MAMSNIDPKVLEKQLHNYNDAYRRGESMITDQEFDEKVEQLYQLNPDADWFKKGVQDKVDDRKEKLPIPMYSLEKVKTYDEFLQWYTSCDLNPTDFLIVTPKYDGISLCVQEQAGDAWTRGDGEFGQRCNKHFELMRNSSWNPQDDKESPLFTFGEAIFQTPVFLRLKETTLYKSARNAVAGLFNSPSLSHNLTNVTYIRYGCDRDDWDKSEQLDILNDTGIEPVKYTRLPAIVLMQDIDVFHSTMNRLFNSLTTGFKCDGLVIEVNSAKHRKNLGRLSNGNPKYAIAYKNPDWSEREETIVKSIDWQISKDGRLAPVVNVESVELCGATVSRCSAYNARYIQDNFISPGARVLIARSGDVIPKHLRTIKLSGDSAKILPSVCPICKEVVIWDENKVDLVCTNIKCDGILLARCVYFFSVLDFKEFREPSIRKLFNAGYLYPWHMINLSLEDLQKIEGLGNVAAKVLSRQFEELRKKGTNLAKLLTALNVFKGVLAEKQCQKILNGMKLYTAKDIDLFVHRIDKETSLEIERSVEGIGEITAIAFLEGLMTWYTFGGMLQFPITYYGLEEKTFEGQMTVVFTGFRNKEWEIQLKEKGHKIGTTVSKKTTCVVVKDKDSGSTKEEKALSLGIPIFTMQEFKEKFEL